MKGTILPKSVLCHASQYWLYILSIIWEIARSSLSQRPVYVKVQCFASVFRNKARMSAIPNSIPKHSAKEERKLPLLIIDMVNYLEKFKKSTENLIITNK